MQRFVSVSIAALLTVVPLAASARDDSMATVQREKILKELACGTKVGRDIGSCLRDKQKTVREMRKRFLDQQQVRVKQWYKDHASEGVGPEYLRALNAFLKGIEEERRAYDRVLQDIRRDMESERRQLRGRNRPVPVTERVSPSTTDKRCFVGTRRQQSQCLRRLLHPVK
ncbi:MAG: hypothetical protein G01um101425_121 [Candidatus Peregrinibacteria bacterium Gr01-1014_25]|nr:MAG: hypothetical protein G01um101425_121 [Candidatus Peregrinibacteria bacterium Gr01-1014_25]